jgi:hypothetical protein
MLSAIAIIVLCFTCVLVALWLSNPPPFTPHQDTKYAPDPVQKQKHPNDGWLVTWRDFDDGRREYRDMVTP